MIPMLFFGIVGGVCAAALALPHGYVAAFLAYVVGGSLCALIPGLLQARAEYKREKALDSSKPSPVGEEP